MEKAGLTVPQLIAPCGIDCRLCRAFGRKRDACPGCRADEALKPKTRVICRIKTCEKVASGEVTYCFDCSKFPCPPLAHLDKRYRTRYATNVIDNLLSIKTMGSDNFLEAENKKWTCPECGALLCMHKPHCLACGYVWRS